MDPAVQAGTPEGISRLRALYERAITTDGAGLHLIDGSKLWDSYINFELQQLQGAAAPPGGDDATERVRELYRRRLSVPHQNAEATLSAYQSWEQQQHDDNDDDDSSPIVAPKRVQRSFEVACRAFDLRLPFETAISQAGNPTDLLAAFLSYIKLEEEGVGDDHSRVHLMYERAIAAFPVTHFLWLQYAWYNEAVQKSLSAATSVYERAIRNCPWVGEIWERLLRLQERVYSTEGLGLREGDGGLNRGEEERIVDDEGKEKRLQMHGEEKHAATYSAAMAAGLQGPEDIVVVALARMDALRRQVGAHEHEPSAFQKLREVCSTVKELLHSSYPDYFDPELRFAAYWAKCEVELRRRIIEKVDVDGVEDGRKVWEGVLKQGNGIASKFAVTWLKYIEFERQYGRPETARALFKRCFARDFHQGGAVTVCQAWLQFEREMGSAEEYFEAAVLTTPVLEKAAAVAAAAAVTSTTFEAPAREQRAAAPREASHVRKQQPQKGKTGAPSKRQQERQQQQQQQQFSREEAKALRQQNDPNYLKKKRKEQEKDGIGGDGDKKEAEEEPVAKKPKTDVEERKKVTPPITTTTTVSTTDVAAAAASVVVDAPPSQPQQGEQQETTKTTTRTINQDGDNFAARRALTAFVKYLPEDANEDTLRELFSPCGTIQLIKLGTNKATGRSKGFAYVEFDSAEGVEKACEMNGRTVGDKTIFVAPSNPPPPPPSVDGGGGRGGGGRGGRGRGRGGRSVATAPRGHIDLGDSSSGGANGGGKPKLGLGFVPRATALKKNVDGGGGAPKSNTDFRKMFLEKKE